ncbi:DUF7168 domain-containing protein [Roseospira visakhapatnamensis]|uniref:DUF2786 domain-containing protein n=1 Tax=Roseospira visakhapatnamensis TaxID=390880 RepID=A0A7W6RFW9_9PROT|nr:DUF2786 domain-containing protein [Roseospira visakhapatnamensis]MBB4267788.1 hypothetical protein [Roseospira visakhapatnamensis]
MADIEDIKRKVRAMLDMTVARGCTEGEATAAAATASRLMSQHGLDQDDLVMGSESIAGTARATPLDALWLTLAAVTGCHLIRQETWEGTKWLFHGRMPGPTIAVYMHTFLRRVVEAAVEDYRRTPEFKRKKKGKLRRRACEAFRHGMAFRLRRSLYEHFGAPDEAALDQARASAHRAFPDLTKGKAAPTYKGRSNAALYAGARAGAGVTLRDGLTGGPVGQIGRG